MNGLRTPALLALLACGLFAGSGLVQAQAQVPVQAQAVGGGEPAKAVPVRFAPEKDYGPFVYAQADGRVVGLSVDILHRLAQGAGLSLHTLPPRSLAEILADTRAGRVDLISSLRPTPERAAFLNFTSPYVSVPAVLVVREPVVVAVNSLAELQGRPVAVGKGYAVEGEMRRRYPNVLWQAVPDDVLALRGVAEGAYAAAVVDAASLAFIQRHHRLAALRAVEQVGFNYALSFAVRKDLPQLQAALEAGIRAIPQAERESLLARWLPAPAEPTPPRAPGSTRLALLLLVLAALLLAWRLARRRLAARRLLP